MADQLADINRKVVQLFALVGEGIAGATNALLSGDREEAKRIAAQDELVDTLFREIETTILERLGDRSLDLPQLRFLVVVLRMLPDLERNGDLTAHIARRAARGLGVELSPRSRGLVERMGEVASGMWRATADAYTQHRRDAFEVVDDLDDEMDDLQVSLTAEVVAGSMSLPVAIELAMIARFFERFGDHAVNLSKRIAMLSTDVPDAWPTSGD